MLFRNSAIFHDISKNGFTVIEVNLWKEIDELSGYIAEYNISSSGFYYSLLANSFEQNKMICSRFKKILHSFYETYFVDYRTITESFLIKPANTPEELSLHQDWCYTEENEHSAYNIWIPLADVSEDNGAMFFLPGSHSWFNNLRSASLQTSRISISDFQREAIETVMLKRGQVLLFHPAVFHGSYPNLSTKDRIVATATILPKSAPFLYFQQGDIEDEVKVFHLDDEALLRNLKTVALQGDPDSPVLRSLKYTHHIITATELMDKSLSTNS